MASKIPDYVRFAGTNVICYRVNVTYNGEFVVTATKLGGGHPTNDFSAEIVIKLDWGELAGFFDQFDTYEVAAAVVPRLMGTNFISELNGHALAEMPIHIIGHSRGASLACQMAQLLGTNGIWVDQITTLDPHPVNEDGNVDPLFVTDAPLRIYENVLFADNYFQTFGGYPSGQAVRNSYNRQLTSLPGGYSSAHSDVHLWYHATIDWSDPVNDSEAVLYANDRATWFNGYEMGGARAGFYYSRLGGGNRLSTDQPGGAGMERPIFGFNQVWDLGAGQTNNRTSLPTNNGDWPNIIRFNLAGTNFMAQSQSNRVTIYAQWAQRAASNAAITIHLDDDFNPLNGNDRVIGETTVHGNGSNEISFATVSVYIASSNSTPGLHSIYAKITGGGHSRYVYAPEPITVMSSLEAPRLDVSQSNGDLVHIGLTGIAGQRVVLQGSTNLVSWQSLATNWLTSDRWVYSEPTAGHRFYRGLVQ